VNDWLCFVATPDADGIAIRLVCLIVNVQQDDERLTGKQQARHLQLGQLFKRIPELCRSAMPVKLHICKRMPPTCTNNSSVGLV
jgi:hypothetical protein